MVDYIKKYYTRVVVNHKDINDAPCRVILPVSELKIRHELSAVSKATFKFWEPPFSTTLSGFSNFTVLKKVCVDDLGNKYYGEFCSDLNGDVVEIYISKQEFGGTYKDHLVFYGTIYNFNMEYNNEDSLLKPCYSVTAYGKGKALEDYYRSIKLGAAPTGVQLNTVLNEILSKSFVDGYSDPDNLLGSITLSQGKDIKNYHDLLQDILSEADGDFYTNTYWDGSSFKSKIYLVSKSNKTPKFTVAPSMGASVESDATKILNEVLVLGAPSVKFRVPVTGYPPLVDADDATFTDGRDWETEQKYPFYWVCNSHGSSKWTQTDVKAGSFSLKTWVTTAYDESSDSWWSADKQFTVALRAVGNWLFNFGGGGKMHFSFKYKVPTPFPPSFPYSHNPNLNEFNLRVRCYCKSNGVPSGYFENTILLTGGKYVYRSGVTWFEYPWHDIVIGFNLYDFTSWEAVASEDSNGKHYPNWNEIECIEFYPMDPFATDRSSSASADVLIDNFSLDSFQAIGMAFDEVSQNKYGIKNREPLKDYDLPTSDHANALAATIVEAYKNPVISVKSISVDPDEVLDIGDPTQVGIAKWKYALGSYIGIGFNETSSYITASQIRTIEFSSKDQMLSCSVDLGEQFIPDVSKTFKLLSSMMKMLDYDIEDFKTKVVAQAGQCSAPNPITLQDIAQDLGVELEMHYQRSNVYSTLANWEWSGGLGGVTVEFADSYGHIKNESSLPVYANHKSKTLPYNSNFWFRTTINPSISGNTGDILVFVGKIYLENVGGITENCFEGVGFLIEKYYNNLNVYACPSIQHSTFIGNWNYTILKSIDNKIASFQNNQDITIMFAVNNTEHEVKYYVNNLEDYVNSFEYYTTNFTPGDASLCCIVVNATADAKMYNGVLARRVY